MTALRKLCQHPQPQLSPAELHAVLSDPAQRRDILLLDLRTAEEYAAWPIRAPAGLRSLNISYFDLLDDSQDHWPALRDYPNIVVNCAHGQASPMVVEELIKRGHCAAALAGGMRAWAHYHAVNRVPMPAGFPGQLLQIDRVARGSLHYMLISGGEAAVFDPDIDHNLFRELADRHRARIRYVFETHLHADQISGARALARASGAPHLFPAADADGARFSFQALHGDEMFELGATRIVTRTLATPGHTPGSLTYLIDDAAMISGDLLFKTSVGRPDLGGAAELWVEDLYDSLTGRLDALPDTLRVLPAHYGQPEDRDTDGLVIARLGDLRREHPVFAGQTRERFRAQVLASLSPAPEAYARIRQINLGIIDVLPDEAERLEIGENRCALG